MDRPVMPGEQAVRALAKAAETYRNRTPQYGTSWKSAGGMLLELFNGRIPEITTEQQALRLFLVVHCVDKLRRYAANLQQDGHADSAADLITYAAMLAAEHQDP